MLTTRMRATSEVESPPSGQATMFVDAADGVSKAKLSNGTVVVAGASGGGGIAPLGVGWFHPDPSASTIYAQLGTLFESIIRSDVGNAVITMTASYADSTIVGVLLSPVGGAARIMTYAVSGNTLQVFSFDAAGAPADADFTCAVYVPAP